MSEQHDNLIQHLSKDLKTTKHTYLFSPLIVTCLCIVSALAVIGVVMYWLQPFRADIWNQLLNVPVFSAELIIGLLATILLCLSAFKSAVPGETNAMLKLSILLYLIWLAIIFSGYLSPVLEPSMIGKREECYYEAVYYSIGLAIVVGAFVRRRYTFRPMITASLTAFFVTMVPAYLMQITCMYEVHHAFTHHLIPAWVTAIILTPLLYWFFKKS